jgi:hypothetical protein
VIYTGYAGDGFGFSDKVKFDKQWTSDSYVAAWGPYSAASAREFGSIRTNGKLKFKDDVVIHGDARAGVNRPEATGGTVTGSRASLTIPISYAPVVVPDGHANAGHFKIEDAAILNSGTYYFENFEVKKNATLTLTGPVTVYVRGNVKLEGTIQTWQNLPTNFQIRVVSKKSVKVGKGTKVFADIYAPSSKVTVDKDVEFFGALIGKKASVKKGAALHYDESLGGHTGGAVSLVQ